MTLTQSDFEKRLVAEINDPEIIERYSAQDPLVLQQIRSNAAYLSLISQDIDIATLEPFIKTRDRSIIADATNKGILPTAIAAQHIIIIVNNGKETVNLTQGRMIEDNQGRPWRLLQSATITTDSSVEVRVEQSEYREISYTPPMIEPFHKFEVKLNDDLYLANISLRDDNSPNPNNYEIKPRWMNVAPLENVINVTTDSYKRIYIEFGDDDKAGCTVSTNKTYTVGILESYGEVDISQLSNASLIDTYTNDEQRISLKFKKSGLLKSGVSPLTVNQLRVMASYPSLYDENAVFLGNFDYLVRRKFISRTNFIAVWNEQIQEKYFGVTWKDINHLNICISAKNSGEQDLIVEEIKQLISRSDSLYDNRVNVHEVVEKSFVIAITGRVAAVHDIDSVKAQITGLLVEKYGKGALSASRWLLNGFNIQEVAKLLKDNIPAFQDKIHDFSITVPKVIYKPNEWIYMSNIDISLERTAEVLEASWLP